MKVTTPKQGKERYVSKQVLVHSSCESYLVNDMHYSILRYDVGLYNLSFVDIVDTTANANDE